jgi:hypothetical protein
MVFLKSSRENNYKEVLPPVWNKPGLPENTLIASRFDLVSSAILPASVLNLARNVPFHVESILIGWEADSNRHFSGKISYIWTGLKIRDRNVGTVL